MNARIAPVRFRTRFRAWLGHGLAGLALLALALPGHAAISFVGAATKPAGGAPSLSVAVPVPGGTLAGDLLLAQIAVRGGTGVAITAPDGWTQILQGTNGTAVRQGLYYRVASAAEPASYTFGLSAKERMTGGIVAYRGVDTAAPVNAASTRSNTSSVSVTANAVTTTVGDAMLVGFFATATVTSFTPPAGMTERHDAATSAGPNGVAIEAADGLQAVAGGSGTRTATAASADLNIGALVALKPASELDHIRLEHSGVGLTCAPSPVTVRACANADCSTLYTGGTTTVTLSPAGWATNPVTFTGSTVVDLAMTTPSTVTLGTSAVAPIPAGTSPVCINGSGGVACQHVFADTGFIFSTIPVQTAGVASASITLQAVKKADDSAACTGLFSGSVTLDMASQCVNPGTCAGRQVAIDGAPIASNPASGIAAYTPVTLNFGANSTATFTLSYPDVGAMSLSARYLLGGTDSMLGTSNVFVVRPFGFIITDIKRTADGGANPAAADATGPAFIKAGASFTAKVTAIAQGGAATPNYGKEIAPEGVKLVSVLVPGLGLTQNPPLDNGIIGGTSFSAGVAEPTALAWNEVGIITLEPSVADADYLGTGDVTGTPSANVGRFYPDHFTLSDGSITNRTDIVPACVPAPSFTYMDEPFQVAFTLTARGAGSAILQNYSGAFAKLVTGSPIPGAFGFAYLDGVTDLTLRVDSGGGISGSWSNGVLAATTTLGFLRGAVPDGPFDALKVGIAPVDADGVTLGSFDMDVAGIDHAEVGQTRIRFGRLRLLNAHGSELLGLPIPIRLQYWDGAQFVTHADDSCTTLASANIGLGNYQKQLDSGETVVSPATINFVGGVGNLRLAAPGAGNSGSVDVCVDLGADPPGGTICAATSAGKAYLQGKWAPGSAWNNDPNARASFGLHRGSRPLIYMREVY